MKKSLGLGKFRVVVGVCLLIMGCRLGVWAQSTTYVKKFSDSFGRGETSKKFRNAVTNEAKKAANEITADERNLLMDRLDGLENRNLADFFIPGGAIVPFYSDECPDGWSEYTVADGKFLMGTSIGHGDVGSVFNRNNKVVLTGGNIPQHRHYLFGPYQEEGNNIQDNSSYLRNMGSRAKYNGYVSFYSENGNHEEYQMRGVETDESRVKKGSSSFQIGGKSVVDSVDITNDYVKVLFCRKNYYDTCPGGYVGPSQIDERDCGDHPEGWEIGDEFQVGNGEYCGKCVAKGCPVGSCTEVAGIVVVGYDGDKPCYQSQECEDSGDSGYRCANPVPYYEAQQLQDQGYQCSCGDTECCCN